MRIAHDHVRVRVPATSGNLGPGFDTMGMAHNLWDEVSATLTTGATRVTILGEGAASLPRDENHLVVRVISQTLERLGLPCAGINLVARNHIQQGKGLGSSAAAIVAGLMIVKGLIDDPQALSEEVMLDLATEYEGHPDNAAPAIYGGATLSWIDSQDKLDALGARQVHTVKLAVNEQIDTSLLVPAAILPTSTARSVLPAQIPHADGVFQASRAALLVHSLEHRPDLLFAATQEVLHQHYRAEAMAQSAQMLAALREAGWPAVISGAGPSILLFAKADQGLAQVLSAQGFQIIDSRQVQGAHFVNE